MEENNAEQKTIFATPCTRSVRKNLLSHFENSEDSGFYSNSPGSREHSYKFNSFFNQSRTPSSDNEGVEVTPGVVSSDKCNKVFSSHHQSNGQNYSFQKDDREVMMNLYYSPMTGNEYQKDNMEVDEFKERSVYMDCEESLYFGDNQNSPFPGDVNSSSDGNKSADFFKQVNFQEADNCQHLRSKKEHLPISSSPIVSNILEPPVSSAKTPKSNGRVCLLGLEEIDILYFLGEKYDYRITISKIFSYLSIRDLLHVKAVSKTWQRICLNDVASMKRLEKYYDEQAARVYNKENVQWLTSTKENPRRGSGLRNAFSQIQNYQECSSSKSTSSPSVESPRTRRFRLFCKEGEKLDKKSRLMPCPRCTLPARCSKNGDYLGQCLCENCKYRFCTACLCDYHYPARCMRISSCPSNSRQNMRIGSKASKRRLSRT